MLTSIDVKFIFDSVCSSARLGDIGLFGSANILQIADVHVVRRVVFLLLFLANSSPIYSSRETSEVFRHFFYSLPKQLHLFRLLS